MDWERLSTTLTAAADPVAEATEKHADYPPEQAEKLAFDELVERVVAFLSEQQEFAGNLMFFTGGHSFQAAPSVARNLLRRATKDGSDAAINWLRRLLETQNATALVVLPIWGLEIAEHIALTPDTSLTPVAELATSPQREELVSRPANIGRPVYAWAPPKVALTRRITVRPWLQSPPADDVVKAVVALTDLSRCLTLVGPKLLMPAPEWVQFEDAEIAAFAFSGGMSTLASHTEIQPAFLLSLGDFDGAIAASLVQQYLALQGPHRLRIQLAVERFHRAMRRHFAADAAVELAIALDALVGDGEGELTWKVSLRSALLAGDTKANRTELRAIVAAVYSLRSTVVHKGTAPTHQKTKIGKLKVDDLVQRGMRAASQVIKAAIARGELPDWFEEELGDDIPAPT